MFSFLDWPHCSCYVTSVVLLNLMPGMNILFICGQSIQGGKRYGVAAALGISTGVAIYIAATILGIGELFKLSPTLFHVIRFLGIAYLFYLAYQAFTSKSSNIVALQDVPISHDVYKAYGKGVLTTLLNPKELMFFCTFLPQFTNEASLMSIEMQLFYLGLWDIISGTIVSIGYAVLVAKIRDSFIQNPAVQNKLNLVSGIIFGALALGLLWSMRDLWPCI
jgi:threonine/homoserine/homoserine lactone efflux protein